MWIAGGHMAAKNNVSLTDDEKRVVKALLAKGWRNQDIQALVNTGRKATINSGRITGVKKNANQNLATDDEVAFFQIKKRSYDQQTGLNQYDDERLIRAREAMILAVQIFNSPALKFKTEVFTMLTNVAWTYLLHEFYDRKGTLIVQEDGRSLLLSQMVEKGDCPLPEDVRNNLRAMKILRDKVEHLILGRADLKWSPIFQACCLNFDKAICDLFGASLTLSNDLSLALQFAKLNIEQLATLGKYELPAEIEAIDALITEGMTAEQLASIEFQFRVIYTLDAASKSQAHFQFVSPESQQGKDIHNVLSKKVAADELYPYKPGVIAGLVTAESGVAFTSNDHVKAWKLFKVRPKKNALQPANTDKRYCLYHPAHKDYTYSGDWISRLVEEATDPERLAAIRASKL
jgi:hypothetical protein